MSLKRRDIEKSVNLLIGKPLAWLLFFTWLGAKYLVRKIATLAGRVRGRRKRTQAEPA